jgi:hypothetical protein
MSSRNPDRIPVAALRSKAETVADKDRAGWDVISRRGLCGLIMHVDLRLGRHVQGAGWALMIHGARGTPLPTLSVGRHRACGPCDGEGLSPPPRLQRLP